MDIRPTSTDGRGDGDSPSERDAGSVIVGGGPSLDAETIVDGLGPRPGRRRSWREWYIVALLVGFVGYCLGPGLVGAKTLLPVNLLSNFYPWIASRGDDLQGHNALTSDPIDAWMPATKFILSQLWSGHLGSWQSLVAGGGELSGVPDVGLLDPLSLPYFVLPLWLAPAFVILLEFVVGIGGCFLFLRRHNLSRSAALLAGLIFCTSGFMVMWTNWPQVRVAALIPALFWATERLIQTSRLRDMVLVAVVVASMLFGGFPEVTGFALYLAGGYVVVRVAVLYRTQLRTAAEIVMKAAGGLVLGALLAMVQLLPFYHLYNTADLTYRTSATQKLLPFSSLVSLFAPNAFGSPILGRPDHGPFNPIELVAYVGSAALALAVAGAAFGGAGRRTWARGLRGYFVAATIVIIVLGWASPTVHHLVSRLPVFSGNFVGRISSILGFTLAVLAAIGFEWLTIGREPMPSSNSPSWVPKGGPKFWGLLVWVAATLAGLEVLRLAHRLAFSQGYWHDMKNALWIPVALLVGALVVLGASRLHPRGRTVAFVVVPLLVVVQGAQFFHSVLPGDSRSNFYPDTPTHQFLAANLGHDRFATQGQTLFPATSLYYGLRAATGHVFHEPAWEDLLKAVDPKVMVSPTYSLFSTAVDQNNVGHQPILDRMAVKYFVLPPDAIAGSFQPLPSVNGAVRAPAPATCTLAGQPLRGISIEAAAGLTPLPQHTGFTLNVAVRQGGKTLESGRYVIGSVPARTEIPIAIAGEDLTSAGPPIAVSATASGLAAPLALAAHDGTLACAAISPKDDGLKLAFADPGSVIYQRLDALPRIRWASRAIVVADPSQRVPTLAHGLPPDEVMLDGPGPAGSGRPADVSVLEDSGDTVSAVVNAEGAGYLVVADAMQQPGWSVTVDGRPAHMVPADDAMVAVALPSGEHVVRFEYSTPGQVAGAALTGLGIVAAVAILIVDRVSLRERRHARRRRGPQPG